ncbi:Ig-like domain-containing protein [Geomonas azotofigens]|uniref:Ig-like domain-containing protein n=1 Tax=Geomonas azotofigens TaxID=2843196 RepID=UPI001C11D51E|nr:Ig-like domain-containing protein [Geomonas azotofigens]MBU5613317.1 Ig-like domain-containing protein [Geomonas azotofigens]
MITRQLLRLSLLVLVALVPLFSGCSGSGNSGTNGSTITIGSSNANMVLDSSSLDIGGSTTATVTFKKVDGSPAAGYAVNFSTTNGTLTPASGIRTDQNGVATVKLTAGSTSGQGQITASAMIDNKLVSNTALFSVNLPPLHLANLRLVDNVGGSINYGSSQGVAVDVLDVNNNPYTAQAVDVVFTSTMTGQGKATINSPVSTVNGVASTTYTAVTAAGDDTITASIAGSSKTITLNVIPLTAASISFVSATPSAIGLKGMGGVGVQDSSLVTFKVLDTVGNPKANQAVTFSLNTNVGGLALSTTTGSTDTNGLVSTRVQSGVIATPVRVTASTTVGTATLTTQSDKLTVSTGVPAQDGFSVSLGNMNAEAFNYDGVTSTVTARLSDHFHNPVPDGTAVSFTTSGGSIEPSCVTVKGACTVTWTSQNPRPSIAGGALGEGRAVILAYAVGEEYFLDLNGNGLADVGIDTLQDDPEAFRDDNENGVHDANETFIDFNNDGIYNTGDGKYNGVLQGSGNSGAPISKNVFSNSVLVMSTSGANITTSTNTLLAPGTFTVTVRDLNGNTMPSGTTIVTSAPFGTLTGNTSYTVPMNVGYGVTLSFNLAGSDTPKAQSGYITITVTTPKGLQTTKLIAVSGNF